MPKYEYACKSCGEHIEVVQSFSDAPLTECPSCAGPLRKVFAAPAISFKGSGFYRTDNRKRRSEPKESKEPAEAKADGASGAKPESTTGAKTDSGSEPAKKEAAPVADAKPKAAEAKTA